MHVEFVSMGNQDGYLSDFPTELFSQCLSLSVLRQVKEIVYSATLEEMLQCSLLLKYLFSACDKPDPLPGSKNKAIERKDNACLDQGSSSQWRWGWALL